MPGGKRRRKSWSKDDHKCRRNAARRREQESDEARAARLQDQRVRTKRKRGRETGEERHVRLQKDKERQRQRRERETEEKRHARLQEQRERTRRRRYEETVEERAARLQKDRERHRMRRQAETEKKREDPPENMWRREISAGVAEHNPCLRQQSLNREKTKQNAQLVWCNISAELQEGSTMEEQKHVVCKEEEGTEKTGRDPLIVQVRSIGDFLTNDSPSHIKMESEDELYQCWDSERPELLKRVAGFPIPPSLLEDDAKDFQFPLGRVKEDLQEERSGEARGKTLLQRDLNISGKAWMGREKLDFCMKVKAEETLEEVDLESQGPLHLKPFVPQDAEEVLGPQRLKERGGNGVDSKDLL
ncbi:zinc finger CCCH domain-containing protein 13-like [Crotalus tigris]|uniref:zinc finger CCCH domain-containing protein 13-like n=1 Tax=Crotalus tigris TaxID=88082 RepID=UPI00192F5A3D|nr:zinc finger CCCH domain-containing protein 13-like [Crotalus tigris]